jgi:hypothetical protein
LYVHFPCFDGVISGVLTTLFLEKSRRWKFKTIQPVNYSLQKEWLNTVLPKRSAVVDFLYHPKAEFWADHHPTTFLTEQLKTDFEQHKNSNLIYDRRSGSCAALLWRTVRTSFRDDQRLEEMVLWAEKIDSAAYESVEEAFSTGHPALVLNKSLAIDADAAYCQFLITGLQKKFLQEVVQTQEVQERFIKAKELGSSGLDRVREAIRLEDSVAIYEVNSEGVLINRYSPYYFYPKAHYSISMNHSKRSIVVSAMRNPWLNFESMHLGEFMRQFGGGGHQRVGSVVLNENDHAQARKVVESLLRELRQAATEAV